MDGISPIDDLKATVDADRANGRAHVASDALPDDAVGAGSPPGADTPFTSSDFDALGAAAGESFLLVCQMVGGEKWKPEPHERSAIIAAWSNYFRARGIAQLPPEAFLAMAIAPYAMKRVQTKSIFSRLLRRNGAQPDSGHDGLGQDHVGGLAREDLP